MNYRHEFRAGNFADVVKHAVLARVVEYMKRKDKPFRVIDTHAGAGVYDLGGDAATRTGEWHDGIGRLLDATLAPEASVLIRPYLDVVRDEMKAGRYPGSPLLLRRLLRRCDRLTAVELHPQAAADLADLFAGDIQTRVIALDGWLALGAHLPPKERRGLVLVDPPFEQPGEFERLSDGLLRAWKRWPGGIYALWYPIKDRHAVARFAERLSASGIPRILDVRLERRAPSSEPRLDGSGLALVNPPYTLQAELDVLLPELQRILGDGAGGGWSVRWLAGEAA